MGRNSTRFWLAVTLCGVLGVIFGATTSEAAISQCLAAENPTDECLTQDPIIKRVEGISMGLFVGIGAAVGATWQIGQKEN